jgi:hypothetical protein
LNISDTKDGDGGLGIGSLVTYADPRQDPYLNLPQTSNGDRDQDLESNSDIEDIRIKSTDNLVLVGHVEGNASILEIYGKSRKFVESYDNVSVFFAQNLIIVYNPIIMRLQCTMMSKTPFMFTMMFFSQHFPWQWNG